MTLFGFNLTPWHFLLAIAIVINFIVAGILLVRARRRDKTVLYFCGFLVGSTLWAIENFVETIPGLLSYDVLIWAANVSFGFVAFSIYMFYRFSVVLFSKDEKEGRGSVLFTLTLFFTFTSFLFPWYNDSFFYIDGVPGFTHGPLYYPYMVYLIVTFLLGFHKLWQKIQREKDRSNKIKIVLVTSGLTTVFLMGVLFMVIWPMFTQLSPYNHITPLGILVLLFLLASAVLQYNLFELQIRITKSDIINVVTLLIFILSLTALVFLVTKFRGDELSKLLVVMVFSVFFLKIKDVVAKFVNMRFFNDYIDPSANSLAQRKKSFGQVEQLKQELLEYFNEYFTNVDVDVFYFDDDLKQFRSSVYDRRGLFLAPKSALVQLIRGSKSVVLVDDVQREDLLNDVDLGVAITKLSALDARAFIGMRHWTNELVMIAFISCDPITDEQRANLKRSLLYKEPEWDKIAQRIYTNKRAMESVSGRFDYGS